MPLENVDSTEGAGNRRIYHDAATGSWAINVGLGFDSLTLEDGLTYSEQGGDTFSIVEGDPLSAKADSAWTISIGRDAWQTRVETQSTLSGDAESFHLTNRLDAYEGNARVFTKTWTKKIPGDNALRVTWSGGRDRRRSHARYEVSCSAEGVGTSAGHCARA